MKVLGRLSIWRQPRNVHRAARGGDDGRAGSRWDSPRGNRDMADDHRSTSIPASRRIIESAAVFALVALGAATGVASPADAACNVIPSADRSFASTLGSVSTPFAQAGEVVAVRREVPAFAQDPSLNEVTVRFRPPGGPETAVTADRKSAGE